MNNIILISKAIVKISADLALEDTVKNVSKARSSSGKIEGDYKNTKTVKKETAPDPLKSMVVDNPVSRLTPGGINAY